MVLTH